MGKSVSYGFAQTGRRVIRSGSWHFLRFIQTLVYSLFFSKGDFAKVLLDNFYFGVIVAGARHINRPLLSFGSFTGFHRVAGASLLQLILHIIICRTWSIKFAAEGFARSLLLGKTTSGSMLKSLRGRPLLS